MANTQQNLTAIIIRGADGKMYYLTDKELAPHQLSEQQAAEVAKMYQVDSGVVHVIDEGDLEKIGLPSAVSAVAVIVSIASLRKWRNRG